MDLHHLLAQKFSITTRLARKITQQGRCTNIPKGHLLFLEHDFPDVLVFPLSGVLGVRNGGYQKNECFYKIISAGVVINDGHFILNTPRSVDLKALTDCSAIYLSYSRARDVAEEICEFHQMLSVSLARKLKLCSSILFVRSDPNPKRKLWTALNQIKLISHNGTIPFNFSELGDLIHLSRNSVSKYISEFIEEGKLSMHTEGFVLHHTSATSHFGDLK